MGFIKERGRSFGYAWKGISWAFRTQTNIRIHAVMALIAITGGMILNISFIEWMFIVATIGIVLSAEMFNTAVEKMVDLISPERQERAGLIKDLSAGAVLIAALMALIIGGIIFIPKILHLLTGSV